MSNNCCHDMAACLAAETDRAEAAEADAAAGWRQANKEHDHMLEWRESSAHASRRANAAEAEASQYIACYKAANERIAYLEARIVDALDVVDDCGHPGCNRPDCQMRRALTGEAK